MTGETRADTAKPSGTVKPYSWRDITARVLVHRRHLIMANAIALLAALVSIPVPLLIPLLVDEVLLAQPGTLVGFSQWLLPTAWHGAVATVLLILLITLSLRTLSAGLGIWQMRQFTRIAKDVTFELRSALLSRLQRVTMARYESIGSGSMNAYLVNDVDTLDQFLGSSVAKLLISVLSIAGAGVILFFIHWQLALFLICFNPVVVYFTIKVGRQVKHLKRQENQAVEVFQQSLSETLDAFAQVRASGREQAFFDRLRLYAGAIRGHADAYAWKSEAASRFSFLIFMFGFDIFRAMAMLTVVFSDLSIGQMFAVFNYLWFIMGPVQDVLSIQYGYQAANGALERINRTLDLEEEPIYPPRQNPFAGKLSTALSLEGVTFGYRDDEPVLRNINMEIAAGEKVAFVGASGGGKTTLIQLLVGFHRPQQGRILFDGVPVEEIGYETLRNHIATVLQHPPMFHDSVRMNITLGREASDEQLWEALRIAQLRDTIMQLPDQLETIVGRQGLKLSGGQRQRLAIARMILQDPRVVILDEATSALDIDTERALHKALAEYLKGRTTIIVAHRLSAVRQAERIIVFEDGRIAQQGSHSELIRTSGIYSSLYLHESH